MASDTVNSAMGLWSAVDYRAVFLLKGTIALCGAALLAWMVRASRTVRPHSRTRGADVLLGTLGLLALACWWNFGLFHFPGYLHIHEQFHYYLGSKYFSELEYTRLYQCAIVADVESTPGGDIWHGVVRNLSTNEIEDALESARDPGACTGRFTPDRWASFVNDVSWFRHHLPDKSWQTILADHGYNPPPTWTMLGKTLASLAPASDRTLLALALIDPVLLLAMWAAVVWAFGWRGACVACLWWGTNRLAGYSWTGGAFLRADWLFAAVVGVCFARRGRFFVSGVALTYSALLRVFPAILIAGVVLRAAIRTWRTRSFTLTGEEKRFATGAAATLMLLVPLSGAVSGGGVREALPAWREFVANIEKHNNTPVANNIGLKTLVSFDPASRIAMFPPSNQMMLGEMGDWPAARRLTLSDRKWLYWIITLIFVVLIARALDGQPFWVALALGTLLIPIASDITCYYYAIFLVPALLWPSHGWTAVALIAVSAASIAVTAFLDAPDDVATVTSLLIVGYSLFAAVAIGGVHAWWPSVGPAVASPPPEGLAIG